MRICSDKDRKLPNWYLHENDQHKVEGILKCDAQTVFDLLQFNVVLSSNSIHDGSVFYCIEAMASFVLRTLAQWIYNRGIIPFYSIMHIM